MISVDEEEEFGNPELNKSEARSKKSNSEISTEEYSDIEVERGSYTSAIKGANMTIKKGNFVIVLGDIGSGKSSLLYAMLNEMRCSKRTSIMLNG
jgi:ABC-type lipoprotein export system ATPase subunit